MSRPRFSWAPVVRVVAAAGLLAAFGLQGRSQEQDPQKAKQVADIQKQIEALNKQLAELNKAPPTTPASPTTGTLPANWVSSLSWRSIGPANMSGRITAISVFEADPTTYWAASASGGLVKTINNGSSFEHQFDRETTVSIGSVCVAPSDRNVVYVGTGENNPRNSVSYGDGVYKSTNGGKSWKHVGLKQTYQVGKVIVHPTDPNTVYVGALGRCYGPNEERGVFKSTDGGANWEKVFYLDDKTGCIDMVMHPTNPDTLLAAMWERKRDEFDNFLGEPPPPNVYGYDPIVKYSKQAGIYKTSDGGKNWKKLENGLPTVPVGRIGLDYFRKDPNVVFAIVDTEKSGSGPAPVTAYFGAETEPTADGLKVTDAPANGPAAKAGLKVNDVLTSIEGKSVKYNYELYDAIRGKDAKAKIKVKAKSGGEEKELEVALANPPAAGGRGGIGLPQGPIPTAGFRAEETEGGLRVTNVADESPAGKAGLKVGDIVTAYEGKVIELFAEMMRDIATGHKPGDKIKLTVKRGDAKVDLELALGEAEMPIIGGGRGGRGGRGGANPRPYSGGMGAQNENVHDQQGAEGFQTGGVFKSTDGGETWTRINSVNPRPMYFSLIRVDPSDSNHIWVGGVDLFYSSDGGKHFASGRDVFHSDHHAFWINPKDGRHCMIGTDGGFYVTFDRGQRWEHMNHAGALGQFYHVAVDSRKPYWVYGGLQDNGSWGGPSMVLRDDGPINEDWIFVNGGDGFVCRVDPNDPDIVYAESQDGSMNRRNLKTGEQASIRPAGGGGRGGQGGGAGGRGGAAHRFNWNTPYILSSHNPSIFYAAGEMVFRSVKRGDELKAISPEITRTKKGSGTALAESPLNPDVLWVGSDDGAVWVTRDGGAKWDRVDEKMGLPGPRWVATIEASRFAAGRAYVAFDAHRSDDDKPYIYVTEDYGQTWKSIVANLPSFGSTRCLREDITNSNLLLCGTEFAAFASINRGRSWTKINNNLPTVAVHEFAFHPTAGEVVAATHGRSLWILDVAPLRQATEARVTESAHLYEPTPAIRWRNEPGRIMMGFVSSRRFVGTNPARGASIYYSLGKAGQKASLKVVDYAGQTVANLPTQASPGLHRVVWNLQATGGGGGRGGPGGGRGGPGGALADVAPEIAALLAALGGGGGGGRGFGGGGRAAAPGTYLVVLTVDGKEYKQPLHVEADPVRGADTGAPGEPDDDDGRDGDGR